MKKTGNEHGLVTGFIIIAVLAVVIYLGFLFAIPYYHYYVFKNEAEGISRMVLDPPDKDSYKAALMKQAVQMNVPVMEENVTVTLSEKKVSIQAKWTEIVDVHGIFDKAFEFSVDIRQ